MKAKLKKVVRKRGRVKGNRGDNTLTVCGSQQAKQIIEEGGQLLPGIPNEITLDHIAPKLPWTAFHMLSSVSSGWQRAIESHQVYDARVRSKSTQTLVALNDRPMYGITTFALFSMEDAACYHLPPIPGFRNGIPWSCECVSLDGKLYVLGGTYDEDNASAEVHVFDIVGQRQWKQCASMNHAREQFGCGVKDGKIYVFGGSFDCGPVHGSEVYDPKEDAWSPITPVPSFRYKHKVTNVGEEFFLRNGDVFDSDFDEWIRTYEMGPFDNDDYDPYWSHIQPARSLDVYHPVKDEWRILESSNRSFNGRVVVGGKLHQLLYFGIEVYDSEANSWEPPQPFSFVGHEPSDSFTIEPIEAVAVDDEVLAIVNWRNRLEERNAATDGNCLIKSKGVGDKHKQIMWQKLQTTLSFDHDYVMCPIQV